MTKIAEDMNKMTIAQLKEELEERGCSTKGCRLKLHYQERLALARKEEAEVKRRLPLQEEETRTQQKAKPLKQVHSPKPFRAFTPVKRRTVDKIVSPKKNASAGGESSSKQQKKTNFSGKRKGRPIVSLVILLLAILIGFIMFITNEEFGASYENMEKMFQVSKDTLTSFHVANSLLALDFVHKIRSEWREHLHLFNPFGANGFTKGGSSAKSGCEPVLTEALLSSVAFPDPVWINWSKEVARSTNYVYEGDVPPKAATILLARNQSYTESIYDTLRANLKQCARSCIKQFSGSRSADVEETRGEIQKELAEFLSDCPSGIVVVESMGQYDPGSLVPFHNAVSEQGGLTHQGKTVIASKGTFFLTLEMQLADAADLSEAVLAKAAREELIAVLSSEGNSEFAQAFRRRIDYIGLGLK
jgi:hypothetical protein